MLKKFEVIWFKIKELEIFIEIELFEKMKFKGKYDEFDFVKMWEKFWEKFDLVIVFLNELKEKF